MEEERRILEFYFHEFGHSFSVSIGYDSLYSFLNFRFKDFMNEYKDHLEPKSYNMSKKELNTYINSEYSDLVKLLCKLPFEIFRFTFIGKDNILKLEGVRKYPCENETFLFFVYPYERANSNFKNKVKLIKLKCSNLSTIAGMIDSFIERKK